jgi:two-component system nitrogen regulation response regulator NtrX
MVGGQIMAEQKRRILVVDDVGDWRATIVGLLEDEGYVARSAATAEEALELFTSEHWDLAIVDIRLDERDETNTAGLDLAAELKARQPDLPVVMITGYSDQVKVEEALKQDAAGRQIATDFIEKDRTEELLEIVSKILA